MNGLDRGQTSLNVLQSFLVLALRRQAGADEEVGIRLQTPETLSGSRLVPGAGQPQRIVLPGKAPPVEHPARLPERLAQVVRRRRGSFIRPEPGPQFFTATRLADTAGAVAYPPCHSTWGCPKQ